MGNDGFIDDAALDRSLSALRDHDSAGQVNDALQQVLGATRELFMSSGAGLMLVDESSALCSVAATDEPGRKLETSQEEAGHGPCVDAVVLDQVTATRDLADEERWPQLPPDLPAAGVRAVLGVPVHLNGVAVGSLNVYHSLPHDWDDSEIGALTAYGGLIEGVLRTALQAHQRTKLADQLQHALDNRVVIERAVGVIMAQQRTDPVSAFDQLRKRARSSERKVADLAAELLDSIATSD